MSNFLVELAFYFFAIAMWIFASPILFGVLGTSNITGATGLILHLIPWVCALFMLGRVMYVFRGSGVTT